MSALQFGGDAQESVLKDFLERVSTIGSKHYRVAAVKQAEAWNFQIKVYYQKIFCLCMTFCAPTYSWPNVRMLQKLGFEIMRLFCLVALVSHPQITVCLVPVNDKLSSQSFHHQTRCLRYSVYIAEGWLKSFFMRENSNT